MTSDMKARILRLYRQGYMSYEIAKELGIAEVEVVRIINKNY